MSKQETVFFSTIITKSLKVKDNDRRIFKGYLTVEMVDKQNEITIVDELAKVVPVWLARGGPISDNHSNRIVGKGITWEKTTVKDEMSGRSYPAIMIEGEIFKNYDLDNYIWSCIKRGEYRGLSFGGSTKSNREPRMQPDGKIAYALKDLEHYEVAVCRDPAVPLALIVEHNHLAKSMQDKAKHHSDGKSIIKCTNVGCFIDKTLAIDEPKTNKDDKGKAFQATFDTYRQDDSIHCGKEGGQEWGTTDHVNRPQKDRKMIQEKDEAEESDAPQITSGNQSDAVGEDPTYRGDLGKAKSILEYLDKQTHKCDGYHGSRHEIEFEKEDKSLDEEAEENKELPIEKEDEPGLSTQKPGKNPLHDEYEGMLSGKIPKERMAPTGTAPKQSQIRPDVLEAGKSTKNKIDYDMRGIVKDPAEEDKDLKTKQGLAATNYVDRDKEDREMRRNKKRFAELDESAAEFTGKVPKSRVGRRYEGQTHADAGELIDVVTGPKFDPDVAEKWKADLINKMLDFLNKPMGPYENFEECERKNQDKGDTGKYCGKIYHETEGKKKMITPTLEGVNGEDGPNEPRANDDETAEGLKEPKNKDTGLRGATGGVRGSYDTFDQGPTDTVQVREIGFGEVEDGPGKKKKTHGHESERKDDSRHKKDALNMINTSADNIFNKLIKLKAREIYSSLHNI